MTYKPPRVVERRTWTAALDLSGIPLPQFLMGSFPGNPDEGDGWVAFHFGVDGCDPIVMVEWRPTGWRRRPFEWLAERVWQREHAKKVYVSRVLGPDDKPYRG